jgi:hypothetical protein
MLRVATAAAATVIHTGLNSLTFMFSCSPLLFLTIEETGFDEIALPRKRIPEGLQGQPSAEVQITGAM